MQIVYISKLCPQFDANNPVQGLPGIMKKIFYGFVQKDSHFM